MKTYFIYSGPFHRLDLDPKPHAPKQDNLNFQSRALTYKDLSIHKDIAKDTASHIVQYNGAAGDFRLVTVSALRVHPTQLPDPPMVDHGGGGRAYVYIYIHIFLRIITVIKIMKVIMIRQS